MKFVVTGGRDWMATEPVVSAFKSVVYHHAGDITCIVREQRGADTLAKIVAKQLKMTVEAHKADWETLGLKAGPIGNKAMLEKVPLFVLAFHDNLMLSKGTKDCVNQAIRMNIPVWISDSSGNVAIWAAKGMRYNGWVKCNPHPKPGDMRFERYAK